MPIIEHWRDGERIATIKVTKKMIERIKGAARVVIPPGQITLVTGDELHFDIDSVIECLAD